MTGAIKTHKELGKVVMRPIQSSTHHPASSMMSFIGHHLRNRLRFVPYLVKDSDSAIKYIASHKISQESIFVKIDIADYYLSGRRHELVRDAGDLIEDSNTRAAVKTLLNEVLASQHVSVDDRIFQVVRGSGMGLPSSGETSDAAYHKRVERTTVDSRRFRLYWGIELYMRFRDDVLEVVDARPLLLLASIQVCGLLVFGRHGRSANTGFRAAGLEGHSTV